MLQIHTVVIFMKGTVRILYYHHRRFHRCNTHPTTHMKQSIESINQILNEYKTQRELLKGSIVLMDDDILL